MVEALEAGSGVLLTLLNPLAAVSGPASGRVPITCQGPNFHQIDDCCPADHVAHRMCYAPAQISAETSVQKQLAYLSGTTQARDNGRFVNYTGEDYPW